MRVLTTAVLAAAAWAGVSVDPTGPGKPDLAITDVGIYQQPGSWDFPEGIRDPHLRMHQFRSYRVIATIENRGDVRAGDAFNVAVHARQGPKDVEIGKARIGDLGRGTMYACFDVYPGSAPAGKVEMRLVVDADHEVAESDESDLSNVWRRRAIFIAPGR